MLWDASNSNVSLAACQVNRVIADRDVQLNPWILNGEFRHRLGDMSHGNRRQRQLDTTAKFRVLAGDLPLCLRKHLLDLTRSRK